jgi:NAD(P)-dependent dehydrogenase (short-subunit alcohol dehydrogenase family)
MSRRHPTRGQRFDGQVAVVTGASSGIGRSLALLLATRGATVVGLARRKDLLDELQAELGRHTPESETVVCDVGDPDAFRDALGAAENQHGRIDHLVNNAGIDLMLPVTGLEPGAPPPDPATVRKVFDVNFFSVVAGTLAVLPGMLERGRGVIVNVSSDSARAPEPKQGGYAASKAAISAFSESIAHEVAPAGVLVHVLYPGWVPTAMGLSGNEDGGSLPPKAVRRTAEGVANLTADRMGGPRIDINAARLPLLAPIARTIAPRAYQMSMRRMNTTG